MMGEEALTLEIERIREDLRRYSAFVKRTVRLIGEAVEALEEERDLRLVLVGGARKLAELIPKVVEA